MHACAKINQYSNKVAARNYLERFFLKFNNTITNFNERIGTEVNSIKQIMQNQADFKVSKLHYYLHDSLIIYFLFVNFCNKF